VLNYPIGDVRWKNGPDAAPADFERGYLHVDQLASVIAISDDTGSFANKRAYALYGKIADEVEAAGATVETKGFLGERYDEDSGLQYLNARYYDPELALFIQPDWFEVTEFGVGTNRYSYSFNDPVNLRDPNGNSACVCGVDVAVAALLAAGVALAEIASDLTDGELNGNGLLAGTTRGFVDGISNMVDGVRGIGDNSGPPIGLNPDIHDGKQGIHTPGHNNNDPDKSQLGPDVDAQGLLDSAIDGTAPHVGTTSRGKPTFDFGKEIGVDAVTGQPTTHGTIHSGKKGSHVVPTNPDVVDKQKEQKKEDDTNDSNND